MEQIDAIRKEYLSLLDDVKTTADIDAIRVKYLGRKGPVQGLMKHLKDASAEQRPLLGKEINVLKREMEIRLDEAYEQLRGDELSKRLDLEALDVTLPGRRTRSGVKHIVSSMLDKILKALVEMGFSVQYGPDIESDYYNFEALNFSADHPARDMQDTFYIDDSVLLRTHTSNIQARIMESNKPPIRIVAPGRCYRNETITARSHVFFTQVEAIYIDKDVSFGQLLSTIQEFLRRVFGRKVEARFRPSYFPFVEPGMEVDIKCGICNGSGCNICKHTGWVEVLGAGMVHPEVLKNGGVDPEEHSGFAWGLGVERFVNVIYQVNDIRLLFENDLRFLEQFAGVV